MNFDDYVKVNSGQTGYYRVSYSPELLDCLAKEIENSCKNESILSPLDIAGLVTDLTELCKLGFMEVDKLMDATSALSDVVGESSLAWKAIFKVLDIAFEWCELRNSSDMTQDQQHQLWNSICDWAQGILKRLKERFINSKEKELVCVPIACSADYLELRKNSLRILAKFDDLDTIEVLRKHMERYLNDEVEADSVLDLCYSSYVGGDDSKWLTLFRKMCVLGDKSIAQHRALSILSNCCPSKESRHFIFCCLLLAHEKVDVNEIADLFKETMEEVKPLPLIHTIYLVHGAARNGRDGNLELLKFFEANWEKIASGYGLEVANMVNPLKQWITAMCNCIWEDDDISRMEHFVNSPDSVLPPTAAGNRQQVKDHCPTDIESQLEFSWAQNKFYKTNNESLLRLFHRDK
eukprot:Nk52_evm28s217 gene=Nk52_evmTU28s217